MSNLPPRYRPTLFRVFLTGLLGLATSLSAYVNPNFTPIDLIRQSETVLHLTLTGDPGEEIIEGTLQGALKGEAATETFRLHLGEMFDEDRYEFTDHFRYDARGHALFFAGDFAAAADDPYAEVAAALLHVGAQWFTLQPGEEAGDWVVGEIDGNMLAVYNGSSEMLVRMSRYILEHPFPEVPVEAGVQWGALQKIADGFMGENYRLLELDLHGALPHSLWILSSAGDRLFRATEDGAFAEETEERGLTTRSRLGTVGDFTGNGAFDLIVYGEEGLQLLTNDGEGVFSVSSLAAPFAGAIRSLATRGGGERSHLVLAGDGHPWVGSLAEGSLQGQAVREDDFPGTPIADRFDVLVADLTGNGQEDILLPVEEGVLVYLQTAEGWSAPVLNAILVMGSGPVNLTAVDFDADGLLDVVVSGQNPTLFLQNRGEGRMESVRATSGEPSYITAPNAIGVGALDQNNNGRTDLLTFYPRSGLHFFFNRGFRSYAFAFDADPNVADGEITRGQKAGVTGLFTPDGLFGAAMILSDGRLVLLPRGADGPSLAAHVRVPAAQAGSGSRVIQGVQEDRPLSAWLATPGRGGAYLGGGEFPGPMEILWTDPTGETRQIELILEEGVAEWSVTED